MTSKTQVFENSLEAVAASPDVNGRHYYGMDGKVILAPSMKEARDALTPGLKRLTQKEIFDQLKADLQKQKADTSDE